jgi:hypothetical protein
MISINDKMSARIYCAKGGGSPKPPPPPKPPSPTTASENLRKREDASRQRRANNYQSTILTGGLGVQPPQGKSLLGE